MFGTFAILCCCVLRSDMDRTHHYFPDLLDYVLPLAELFDGHYPNVSWSSGVFVLTCNAKFLAWSTVLKCDHTLSALQIRLICTTVQIKLWHATLAHWKGDAERQKFIFMSSKRLTGFRLLPEITVNSDTPPILYVETMKLDRYSEIHELNIFIFFVWC